MSGSKGTSVGSLLAVVLSICGCGTAPDDPAPPVAGKPPSADTAPLPKLGDPLPLLDDGRIEIAPPEGWQVPGRSSKYLALFQQGAGSKYPAIILTGEDYDFPDVGAENADELASKLAAELSLPSVKPASLGSFVGVTYRKRSKERDSINKIVDRLFLETVVAGRKYRLELRTWEDSSGEAEPYFQAVAQGIKFLAAQADEPPAASDPPAAEPPKDPQDPPEEKPEPEDAEKPGAGDLDLDDLDLDDLLK